MNNQAQIDALQHLLLAVLNSGLTTVPRASLFEQAQGSIMGSNGPSGPDQKSLAMDYLQFIQSQVR